jgi:hypothetical protein
MIPGSMGVLTKIEVGMHGYKALLTTFSYSTLNIPVTDYHARY